MVKKWENKSVEICILQIPVSIRVCVLFVVASRADPCRLQVLQYMLLLYFFSQNSITISLLNRRPVPVLVGPPGPFAVQDCADCIFRGVRIFEYSYRVHSDVRHASSDYNCFCTNPTNILSAVAIMKSFVIQDSWYEEDDV